MTEQNKKGRPVGTTKSPTVKPSLRVNKAKWEEVKRRYPKGVNKLFNQFIENILK